MVGRARHQLVELDAESQQLATPAYQEPPEEYAARFIKEDTTTSGNWGGVYGKDGYALCNYNGAEGDKKSLPRRSNSRPLSGSASAYAVANTSAKPVMVRSGARISWLIV